MGNTTEGNFTAMIYSRERWEEKILLEETTLAKRSSLQDSSEHDLYSERERESSRALATRTGQATERRERGRERLSLLGREDSRGGCAMCSQHSL